MKEKFGSILKKDEHGNLVPDYGMHKRKYKTQIQLDEEERRQKLNDLREKAKKLSERRNGSESPEKGQDDYERGLANIRQRSFESYSKNKQ